MARFTIYSPTPDIDEHYAPALGCAGGRCYNREPNMYLIQTAEDALIDSFSMVGCKCAPRWLEKLCDKCEAALAKEEEEEFV